MPHYCNLNELNNVNFYLHNEGEKKDKSSKYVAFEMSGMLLVCCGSGSKYIEAC